MYYHIEHEDDIYKIYSSSYHLTLASDQCLDLHNFGDSLLWYQFQALFNML